MADYKLSRAAKEDVIRIHQFGIERFGLAQADRYVNNLFNCFETVAERPFSFEAVDFIRQDYRRCVCGADAIFYRIQDNKVEIMAIIGRQDIGQII